MAENNAGYNRRITFLWDELKRPATSIAIFLAIVSMISGLLISLHFYRQSEKHGEIIFTVSQVQIFQKQQVGEVPLTIHDKEGRVIDNNVYAADVTIWNGGNANVRKEDVRESFFVNVESTTAKIIEMSPSFFSRNNADKFSFNRDTGELTWQNFDEGEGLKLRVIYTDNNMRGIGLRGYAVNSNFVNGQQLEKKRDAMHKRELTMMWIVGGIGAIAFFLFTILALIERVRSFKPRSFRSGFFVGVVISFCTGLALGVWTVPPVVPKPPF